MIKTAPTTSRASASCLTATRLAFRYRLYPTKAQVFVLEATLGVCREGQLPA